MIIYHGSENVITKPIFGAGNPKNDYGRGFYCTEDKELSKEYYSRQILINGTTKASEMILQSIVFGAFFVL